MHALNLAKTNIDIRKHIINKSSDEFINNDLLYLINKIKDSSNDWEEIATFNPYGLTSSPPTIASVTARLDLKNLINYKIDNNIVNSDGLINCLKIAIEQTWSISRIAKRLNIEENHLRKVFADYLNDSKFLDKNLDVYMPSLGGISLFIFGDIKKLEDKDTEITLRIHDACLNSDCFRGTICTCSPYLLYAIENCVKTAQNGGVGVIIYYRKEGRSLGEVIKFRVYSARQNNDIASKYFNQTVKIAGVEDCRFQELMPDPLIWLGIKKIKNLYSMSNLKYNALNKFNIYADNRFDLPECLIPKDATVEITAKIDSGYHTSKIEKKYNIDNTREICLKIYNNILNNNSKYFEINLEKLDQTVDDLLEFILKKYPKMNIGMHSRLNHIPEWYDLVQKWKCPLNEKIKRLIDLLFVSVLLDGGSGENWKYISNNIEYRRSEGLGKCVYNMFISGFFSLDEKQPYKVDMNRIKLINLDEFKNEFQISKDNILIGLENRLENLVNFSKFMINNDNFNINNNIRPGNIFDKIYNNLEIDLDKLYEIIFSFSPIINDVHYYKPLDVYVPFHKILQWLSYSLIDLFKKFNISIRSDNYLTALPEYRNGGFLIDSNIINFKNNNLKNIFHEINSDIIIELRASTIVLIDIIKDKINIKKKNNLNISQVLEGGTWRYGRYLANKNNISPIKIKSNGIIF